MALVVRGKDGQTRYVSPKKDTSLNVSELGKQLVSAKIENMKKDQMISQLGTNLADIKIRLLRGGL